jgi:segregation and condensation protein B
MQDRDLQLLQTIEALVFASEEAITISVIRQIIGADLSQKEIEACIEQLNRDYLATGRTFRIHAIAGGYRFLTEPEFSDIVRKLQTPIIQRRLSQSILEVLAVVAWHQPVTRGEIHQIRGVNPDYSLDRLLARDLVEVRGRADTPGRPLQYGTTKAFLDLFHLSSLKDLPKLREIKEILQDSNEEQYLSPSGDAPFSGTSETQEEKE